MKFIFVWSVLLCTLSSCNTYSPEVKEALELSGDNHAELEKVLEYFKSRGKVAYESACFLIGNMKYHKSKDPFLTDSVYRRHFRMIDSVYNAVLVDIPFSKQTRYKEKGFDSLCRVLGESFRCFPTPYKFSNKSDLEVINADFLIDNIEEALGIWDAERYTYKKDFDFFKEFILPYRTTNEYPEFKRSQIRVMYQSVLTDTLSVYAKLERYKAYINGCRWINHYVKPTKHLGIYDLFLPKFKMDCHNMTNWSCNVFRACGLPAVYEFTPKWTDRDRRHFWCVSLDSAGILQPYTAPDNNLRQDWESDIRYAGKVYRRTYGAQKDTPYFLASEDEFVPEVFRTPLLNDQTFRYHQTVTLRIPLMWDISGNLAYLGMFTMDNEIVPVGWGEIDRSKREIIYRQVPLNTLFFPVCYDGEDMLPIGEPFIICTTHEVVEIPMPLTMNEQPEQIVDVSVSGRGLSYTGKRNQQPDGLKYCTLFCDTTRKIRMHLLRKYPEKRRMRAFHEKLKGVCLLGGNQERGNYDTLFILQNVPAPYLQEVLFNNNKAYRYYRFRTLGDEAVNIAHMEFLGNYSPEHTCLKPTPLPVFSATEQAMNKSSSLFRINGVPLRTGSKPENAFDGNFNTYVGATSIGMDFKTPVCIKGFRFIPRNANNMIVPGNCYLLLYYDGNGWKEHKILYAKHHYLDFVDVPVATLYRLKNLTEGKEELPFFYKNGKQYFLHIDIPPL